LKLLSNNTNEKKILSEQSYLCDDKKYHIKLNDDINQINVDRETSRRHKIQEYLKNAISMNLEKKKMFKRENSSSVNEQVENTIRKENPLRKYFNKGSQNSS